jgi:integrase
MARRVDSIRPSDIDAALAEIAARGAKGGGPLSARSVHHCRGTLRQVFKMLERDGTVASNPVALSTPVAIPQKPPRSIDAKGVEALLNATEGTWLHIAVRLMLATGLRRGELLGLRWSDLKPEGLSVTRSLKRTEKGWRDGDVKTRSSMRIVSIGPNVRAQLEAHIESQKEKIIQQLGKAPKDWWIVEGPDGGQANAEWLTKSLTQKMRDLGLQGSAHALRHSHASLALDAGAALPAVSARLGHSNSAITAQIYAHRLTDADRRLADSLDGYFTQSPHNTDDENED